NSGAFLTTVPVKHTETTVWTTPNSSSTALISVMETALDGLSSAQVLYKDQSTPVKTISQTTYPNGVRTVTTTKPEQTYSVSQFTSGRLTTFTEYAPGAVQITQ